MVMLCESSHKRGGCYQNQVILGVVVIGGQHSISRRLESLSRINYLSQPASENIKQPQENEVMNLVVFSASVWIKNQVNSIYCIYI